ncbi:MAG: hypothetical protein HY050_05515 [Actinobacteria bacterium]|nr:hypothetical protein [Actinomycetota bacterium]
MGISVGRKVISALAAPILLLSLSPYAEGSVKKSSTLNCGWDSSAGWVKRENQKEADPNWANGIRMQYSGDFGSKERDITVPKWTGKIGEPQSVEGWFDSTSATCGDQVGLHISGNGAPVKIRVYRMGYYGGDGARLITAMSTKAIPDYGVSGISSPPESTVVTRWPVAWILKISNETPPGQYLIRLDDGVGASTFVPLTVSGPEVKSDLTFISSVLTWQAYNQWGGYSLYKGPDGRRNTRSTVVSLDRPYDGDGSGQFRYMEYPVLKLAEKLGIDLNYITDINLDKNPESLLDTSSILFGGHGEYWTTNMRAAVRAAVDRGVNLVSLGGNAAYGRPRLQANDRQMVMWRSSRLDPNKNNPVLATTGWRQSPILKPESTLLGAQYVGLGVNGDYAIPHRNRWPFSTMTGPDLLKNIVGREVDSPLYSVGPPVETLATSTIIFHRRPIKVLATYYTNSKNAGVLDISTNGWVCAIDGVCPWRPAIPAETQTDARLITEEILKGLARGPLGVWRPAIIDIPERTKANVLPRVR